MPDDQIDVLQKAQSLVRRTTSQQPCREAVANDFAWLSNFKESKCVSNLSKSDITCAAPMHFLTPCYVLICSVEGNMHSERLIYVQKVVEEIIRTRGPLVQTRRIRPGKPYIIRQGPEHIRGVVVGMGATPGTYHCICIDFNGIADCTSEQIFDLPPEMSPLKLPTNLYLAKIHMLKFVPEKCVGLFKEAVIHRATHNVYLCRPTFIFEKDYEAPAPVVNWTIDHNTWFTDTLEQYEYDGVVFETEKRIPVTTMEVCDRSRMITKYNYGFSLEKHGHPDFPLNTCTIEEYEKMRDKKEDSKPQTTQQSSPPIDPEMNDDGALSYSEDSILPEQSSMKEEAVEKKEQSRVQELKSLHDLLKSSLADASNQPHEAVKCCGLALAHLLKNQSTVAAEEEQINGIVTQIASL